LPEVEIAEILGCSRSPIREAFRILAQEGLVEIQPGKGAAVAPMDPSMAAEFYDTRALLEAHATRLATPALTDEDIGNLRSLLDGLKAARQDGDLNRCRVLNDEFHRVLYSLCPNKTLTEIVTLCWRRTLRYGQVRQRSPESIDGTISRKERLFGFLERRDADGAAGMMEQIVLSGKKDVVNTLTRE